MAGEEYRKVFAKKLNHYMDIRGKKQADLCRDLGFDNSTVSTWCLGKRIPRPEIVDMLANYFRVQRSDLLEFKKEGDATIQIGNDGKRLLQTYNNSSTMKILFDSELDLSDEDAKALINIIDRMKKAR